MHPHLILYFLEYKFLYYNSQSAGNKLVIPADVINFDERPEITTNESRRSIRLVGASKQELIRCDYFNLEKILVTNTFKDEINANFKVYSTLKGNGNLIHSGTKCQLKKRESYFIPASLEACLEGQIEILKSYR